MICVSNCPYFIVILNFNSSLSVCFIGLQSVDASGPACKTNKDCVLYCSVPIIRGTGICFDGHCTCQKKESISNARKFLHD